MLLAGRADLGPLGPGVAAREAGDGKKGELQETGRGHGGQLYEAEERHRERSPGYWGGGSPVNLFLLPTGPPKFRVGP